MIKKNERRNKRGYIQVKKIDLHISIAICNEANDANPGMSACKHDYLKFWFEA